MSRKKASRSCFYLSTHIGRKFFNKPKMEIWRSNKNSSLRCRKKCHSERREESACVEI